MNVYARLVHDMAWEDATAEADDERRVLLEAQPEGEDEDGTCAECGNDREDHPLPWFKSLNGPPTVTFAYEQNDGKWEPWHHFVEPVGSAAAIEAAPAWEIEDCDHGQNFDVHKARWGTIAHCGSEEDAREVARALNAAPAVGRAIPAERETP